MQVKEYYSKDTKDIDGTEKLPQYYNFIELVRALGTTERTIYEDYSQEFIDKFIAFQQAKAEGELWRQNSSK